MTLIEASRIVLVMLLWSLCFPLITAGIAFSPHLTFAALRAIVAGLSLVALGLALGRPTPKGTQIWLKLALVGICATSLAFLGMFHAAEFVSPGLATVIANTQPLLAAVLAGFFLGEKTDASGKIGLALGLAGIILISSPQLLSSQAGSYAVGIAYIVLAALGVTISNVVIKQIAGAVDGLMAMGAQLLIGSVPLIVAAVAIEDPGSVHWSPRFVIVLLSLSLLGSAAVYWLWFSILERVAVTRANAFSFLIPVFGLSMGVLFFGETIGWFASFGIGLIAIGISLVNGLHRSWKAGDR